MKFIVTPGPFQRGKAKTGLIMRDLMIALLVVWAAGVAYNFTIGTAYGLKAILMVLVASLVTILCDILVMAIRYKPEQGPFGRVLLKEIRQNFSLVTALIFALTLPIGTPYYVIILGSIFGTLLVKYAFGGFGNNIFNPAAFARIFVALTFASSLVPHLGDATLVPSLTAGATITSAYAGVGLKWLTDSLTGLNVNMWELWAGFYSGALGEPFTILILLLGIGLTIRKVINWRTPVFYLGTVALTALAIALFAGLDPLNYVLIHLGMGGLAFGAIFMLTDPVSSPTSPFGKALIGVIAGLMTVLIRVQGQLPEGVVFAIAIANVLSPLIDRLTTSMTNKNMTQKWVTIASMLIVSLAINGSIAFVRVKGAAPSSSSESSTSEEPIIPFRVLSGSYDSAACDEAEYCPVQTQTVNVNLDQAFTILSIELSGTNTTGGSYRTNWTAGEATVVAYYESLSIAEIQAIDPLSLPEDALVAGVTETSQRLAHAIQDAVADVEVYVGSATSNAEPEHYPDQTTTVTVYVIDGDIASIALSGTVTTGGNYQRNWDAAYQTVFEYYVGMSVDDFLALGAFPEDSDAFVAGLTFSAERLYDAMVDALVG